jgi:transposase
VASGRGAARPWQSGQSYSGDLRSRVLAALDGGSPAKAGAQLFQLSVSCISEALGRRDAAGESEARPQRNQQTLKRADDHAALAAEVALRPDVTLDEVRARLRATHGVSASPGLLRKTLARLGLTRTKSRAGPRSRTAPTSPGGALPGGASKPG